MCCSHKLGHCTTFRETCLAMVPNAAYFEFLLFDFNKSEVMGQETVDFTRVEVGKMYEVFVTIISIPIR